MATLTDDQLTQIARVVASLHGPPRLAYNIKEAAEATGIDEQQISKAIGTRQLKARKIGKSWRILTKNPIAWLDQP